MRTSKTLLTRLLLAGSSLVSLGLCALLPHTNEASLAPGIPELPVRLLLAGVVGNLALLDDVLLVDRNGLVAVLDVAGLLGGLDVLGAGVTLLGCL